MCGIVGIISSKERTLISSLTNAINHRGPDDYGYFEAQGIALGNRRLAIQDLSEKGHQPMFSSDGNWVITFNGEIYNHPDVRKELVSLGYHFNSTSDTETLLYGYIHYKEKILYKLNGIFSFAVYNIPERELFIARDQLGIKPLYYYHEKDVFLFGSEIKSFLQYETFDTDIDAKGLVNYLSFLWSPGDTTALKYTKKLLPGHYLKFSIDDVKVDPVRYYDIPFGGHYLKDPEEKIADQLEQELLKAVESQLLSDVPVGFFLSGGLDSSLLVAMAKKLRPEETIRTFSIDTHEVSKSEGFADDLYYAKIVADHLKVSLEVVDADVDIVEDFDRMIWHLDEPQADAAPLNVLNICKRARELGYKVLISGAGGDDLFSGYRRHQALHYEKFFSKVPKGMGKAGKGFLNALSTKNPRVRRMKKLLAGIDKSRLDRMAGYFTWLPLAINKSLFTIEYQSPITGYDPLDYLKELLLNIPDEGSDLNKILYWEMKTFLPDHNLNYTDKLSMAVGVEVRVPYLDIDLINFAASIPPALKMKGKETKYILKKVAERYLPNEVIYRPKSGFGAPVRKWITEDLEDKISSELSPDKLREEGILNPEVVWQLIKDNKTGKIDASYTIWCLLAIESWIRQFTRSKDNNFNETISFDSAQGTT